MSKKRRRSSQGTVETNMIIEIAIDAIIERKMHIGHKRATLHPFMRSNMSRIRTAFTVFDVKKVKKHLEDALRFLNENKDKNILFLFAKERTRYIKEVLPNTSLFLFKWINGFLSNFDQVQKSISKLNILQESNTFESKREKHQFIRMQNQLCGVSQLTKQPDIIICTDAKSSLHALQEAKKCSITTIAITDSDVNPNLVDYPILSTDDKPEAVLFILQNIVEALGLIPNIIQITNPEIENIDINEEVDINNIGDSVK